VYLGKYARGLEEWSKGALHTGGFYKAKRHNDLGGLTTRRKLLRGSCKNTTDAIGKENKDAGWPWAAPPNLCFCWGGYFGHSCRSLAKNEGVWYPSLNSCAAWPAKFRAESLNPIFRPRVPKPYFPTPSLLKQVGDMFHASGVFFASKLNKELVRSIA